MSRTQKVVIFTISVLAFFATSGAFAHPWGGLVVDENGHVYFTFICPLVDDDHYACVWRIDDDNTLASVLEAERSPSDIILARSQNRTIFGAERNPTGVGHQARLWRLGYPGWETFIAPTMDPTRFHIQAYAVNDEGIIFFARGAQLFERDTLGTVSRVDVDGTFSRIDAMAWGPDGRLYIIDQSALSIRAADGTLSTLATDLKEEEPEDLPFAGANILFDLAVDDDGTVYVAYYGNRRVLKVSASGEVTTYLHSASPWSPHGIDVYNGDVYVLESTVGGGSWWKVWERPVIIPRVRKVQPDGSVTTVLEYRRDD